MAMPFATSTLATSTLPILSLSGSSISASSSASQQAHVHPRGYCLLMAASRSSHVGGSRDALSAKPRLSSSSSVKAAAMQPRASATTAVSPSASSQGTTSQGGLPFPRILLFGFFLMGRAFRLLNWVALAGELTRACWNEFCVGFDCVLVDASLL